MATTTCSECPKFIYTSSVHYPFCSEGCIVEDRKRRARRGETASTPRTPRPGRLAGF